MLSYKNTGSIKFWLAKVLKNEYLNTVRNNKKFIDNFDEIINSFTSNENPIDLVIQNENIREIANAIATLPEKYKMIMMYSVYMQFSDKDIAKLMNTNESNIRKIKFRARQKLKEILYK